MSAADVWRFWNERFGDVWETAKSQVCAMWNVQREPTFIGQKMRPEFERVVKSLDAESAFDQADDRGLPKSIATPKEAFERLCRVSRALPRVEPRYVLPCVIYVDAWCRYFGRYFFRSPQKAPLFTGMWLAVQRDHFGVPDRLCGPLFRALSDPDTIAQCRGSTLAFPGPCPARLPNNIRLSERGWIDYARAHNDNTLVRFVDNLFDGGLANRSYEDVSIVELESLSVEPEERRRRRLEIEKGLLENFISWSDR